MNTKGAKKKAVKPPTSAKQLIPKEVIERLTEIQRMIAEGRLLTEQLSNWALVKQHLEYSGEDPKAHWERLLATRADLTQKLLLANKRLAESEENKEAIHAPSLGRVGRVGQETLGEISNLLIPWHVLDWSLPSEQASFIPPGPSSIIETSIVDPGMVEYDGLLVNDDPWNFSAPANTSAKWWGRTWLCSVVIPPPTEPSWLFYRFGVASAQWGLYAVNSSGLYLSAVTVGTSTDVGQRPSPRSPSWHWGNLTLAEITVLEFGPDFSHSSDRNFSGSFSVEPGQEPAIALVYSVLVGLSPGLLRIHESGNYFFVHQPNVRYGERGMIEYRYIPQSFIDSLHDQP